VRLAALLLLFAQEEHPFSLQLRTLEKDVTGTEYPKVVEAMIPTDLEAEWQRVATPDNYHAFEKKHGGAEKVAVDPKLKAAYDRRKEIAEKFLAIMRDAFAKKKRKAPFDDPATLAKILEKSDRRGEAKPAAELSVREILAVPGAEKEWPAFRGPTGRSIVFDAKIPMKWGPAENLLWKTELPGKGNSSPVVWGNRIFTTSEGEKAGKGPERLLLCYDRTDGKLLWKHATEPAKDLETLYWKNTFASGTPVTDGERVIAFFGNGGLLCTDLEGKRLWHRDLGSFPTTHGTGASPVLYKDLVILIQDQNKGASLCAAFDKKTGEERWRRERKPNMCWASPVLLRVGDRDELVFNGSHEVTSYDPATGEILWKAAGPSRESVPMIAIGGGLLYSASGRNGPVFAIRPGGKGDVTETHVVWRNEIGGPHVPSPQYHDGRLYLINDTGVLTCLEAATGSVVYQQRMRGWFSMSPLLIGDLLLMTNENGVTSIVKTGPSCEVLAENDLGEKTLATPAVLGGRIYFRTEKHLICVGESK
jgi:outer membrane protein assembly factor BamB